MDKEEKTIKKLDIDVDEIRDLFKYSSINFDLK
jgi:hypothetical protein